MATPEVLVTIYSTFSSSYSTTLNVSADATDPYPTRTPIQIKSSAHNHGMATPSLNLDRSSGDVLSFSPVEQ